MLFCLLKSPALGPNKTCLTLSTKTTPSKESTVGNHNQQATNTTTIVKHKQKEGCNHGKLHSTLKRYSFHTSLPDVPQSPLLCRSLGSPTVSLRNVSKSASMPSTSMSTVLFKPSCKWRCMWKTTKLWSESATLILKPWVMDHFWTGLGRLYRMER